MPRDFAAGFDAAFRALEFVLEAPDVRRGFFRRAERAHAIAITQAVKRAGDEAKEALRDDVRRARMGPKLPTTWRGELYPGKGRSSAEPAYWIYSEAPEIVGAHARGEVIRAAGGGWLAIPIPGSPAERLPGKSKIDEARRRFDLRPIPAIPGVRPAMLVATDVRFSRAQTPRLVRKARLKSGGYGVGAAAVPMFWLVRQVRLRKRLHPERVMREAAAAFPGRVRAHYRAAIKAAVARAEREAR